MKHAIILVHPAKHSFTSTMAEAYADAAKSDGADVMVRDLYRMGFNPCLQATEIPTANGFHPGADVVEERALLADVDVFALFYPLWFNAPPAMMKGYVDRVFGMGFGYGPGHGGQSPLLKGRKLISFTSSGAPEAWLHETGAFDALYKLFDQHVSAMCGLELLEHVHIGSVTSGFPEMAVEVARDDLRDVMSRHRLAPPTTHNTPPILAQPAAERMPHD